MKSLHVSLRDKIYLTSRKDGGISLISFCAQYGSAAFARLLLQYGAETNEADSEAWYPVDYAILRQDQPMIAAFRELRSDQLRHDPTPEGGKELNGTRSLLTAGNTVLAGPGHPSLAILLARRCDREMEFRKGQ